MTSVPPLCCDRVHFLVKDPRWAFVGWELTAATRNRLGGEPVRPVLQVHDVTDILFDGTNAHHTFQIEITGSTDHWYLELPVPGRVYLVDLGLVDAAGSFTLLARSRPEATPRVAPAPGEECWSTIRL